MWKIQATFNPSFYWSNSWGWVDEDTSDVFTPDERASLTLPISGRWVWFEDMEFQRASTARTFVSQFA